MRRISLPILCLLSICLSASCTYASKQQSVSQAKGFELEAFPRMLRVDLIWNNVGEGFRYEVQRAPKPNGTFKQVKHITPTVHLFSDYVGKAGVTHYYRVRAIDPKTQAASKWSKVVSATTTIFDREEFLTEVQEAGFRYFYNYAYPGSNLPREGIKSEDSWDPEAMSAVSTGMYFFNIAVGIERGFITREEGTAHVADLLRFLDEKTEKFYGAFPHWIDGKTGKVRPFSPTDNGADMVETGIIAEGLIFAREYFDEDNVVEKDIRARADKMWKAIEWDKFIRNPGSENVMIWHWTPQHGFSDLRITGFNEAEICYILGVASTTFPISPEVYWDGWVGGNSAYYNPRQVEAIDGPIDLLLTWDYGIPMFVMHYSYMGLDPRKVPLQDGRLFDEFVRLTQANHDYAQLNPKGFKGYGKYWGLTASLNPDGYSAHHPVHDDNGTITPTGALSSIAYLPEEVIDFMCELYLNEGEKLWGPFGFYDAFNPSRDWYAEGYIGIDVGPIAPMIENYRSGKLWEAFMRAPEIDEALQKIWSHPKAH
ncbi:MAG: beta-glucosidase [Coraliomargarita sp.]|nr:beta-glucosidase [Coraliomargarita sp.]